MDHVAIFDHCQRKQFLVANLVGQRDKLELDVGQILPNKATELRMLDMA